MPLTRAVEAAVRHVRSGNPLLPVSVVVPSPLVGQWLGARLFADTGHLAIEFLSLHELAWRVAAPSLLAQGRARVPESVDLALLLAAAAEAVAAPATPDYLRAAVAMRGFAPAALRTLRDLLAGEVGAAALEDASAAGVDPERLRLLARLARGFAGRLEAAGLLDRPTLLDAAAASLPSAAIGGVVLCEPGELPQAAVRFVAALQRSHPLVTLDRPLPAGTPRARLRRDAIRARLSGSPGSFAAEPAPMAPASRPTSPPTSLARLQRDLFAARRAAGECSPKPLDASVCILAAAGESLEAVEIARLVQQAVAEGRRLSDVAVLLHDVPGYAAQLASAFGRAGVPAFFVEGDPAVDPAARSLGLLLRLLDGDLERRAVMEFFTAARVPWEALLGEGAEIGAARWDRLSAEAGIVSGLDSWRARLRARRAELAARPWDAAREIRLCDSLGVLIERLAADLAAFPASGGWSDFLAATTTLLDRWVLRSGATRERLERVLNPLGRHAPPPSREQFLARVLDLLATQTYREGGLEDERVFVGSIESARGLSFGLVFVPGVVERSFPPPFRPDPLLLDEERTLLSPGLTTTRDAVEAERLLFFQAVNAARQRLVLSYPRFATGSGRVRMPSSFLLQAVEAATGERVGTELLAGLATAGETGLGRAHPTDPASAIDRVERDLALVASGKPGVARHLLVDAETVARALALDRAAWEPRLTPYDGLVDVAGSDDAPLAKLLLAGNRSSATKAQAFAACPYKHLLGAGFGLRPWEEPERGYQVDGKTWGSLYHEVVERLFVWLQQQAWLPIPAEREGEIARQLDTLVDDVTRALVDDGGIVNAALLEPAKARLRVEVAGMLARERAAVDDGFVPSAFEQRFEAVEIEIAPGRSVAFNGFLDRVDVRPEPFAVRVVDYKTGWYGWKDGEQFRGGRELQLALYNEAAARLYPGAVVAEARYYHATSDQRFRSKACAADEEVASTLRRVLRTLDDTARQGVFAPVADSCEFCDFETVCGLEAVRQSRAARKRADPRLAGFLSIREIR